MLQILRLIEAAETLGRLALSRFSYVAALERFHKKRGNPAPSRAPLPAFGGERNEASPELISLVVLSLHGAEMLRTLFASIIRHNTWPDVEVLIVDHGGDEETQTAIEEASRHLNIRHLKPGRNFNFSFSCNRAAQVARGDVVVFLNNDIEFTEDILPGIVTAARSGENLVGVKFWYKKANGDDAERPQTGIRFRWNERRGWTVPYEAIVEGASADRPCEIPAITAAVLGVSRKQFLNMGGFHENYLYAYEDVDFCLKAETRFGKKAISLNGLSARHLWGATRIKRSSRKKRRDWHRYSMSVFRSRCGYLSRHLAWLGLFDGSGFDWGRGPAIALIAGKGTVGHDEDWRGIPGFEAVQAGLAGYNLYGYDVLVCGSPGVSPGAMRHLGFMTLRVAWVSAGDEGWSSVSDFYDVFVAKTGAAAKTASRALDRPVHCLERRQDADGLRALLADFIKTRFRVLVVASSQGEEVAAVAAGFRREGHSVHVRSGIEPRETLRYDVAIWFEPATHVPAAGTIHVAMHDVMEDRHDFYDVHCGSRDGNIEIWFEALMREVRACHERFMAGPEDAPLDDVVAFDDADAEVFWNSHEDPTAGLIGHTTRPHEERV